MIPPSSLPVNGYLRLKNIVGDYKANPPMPAIINVSKSTWWNWVKEGKAPQPIKIGKRITVWRTEEIQVFLKSLDEQSP